MIVSTDDQEIADISKEAGAEVPFLRPRELAEDTSPTISVLQHAVSFLKEKEGYEPDYILLIEATSPCRQPFHIQEAVKIIEETEADSVVGLGEAPKHFSPFWQFNMDKANKIELFSGESITNVIRRRQELPTTYYRNGAFYLFRTDLLFTGKPSLYGNDVRGYVIEPKYSVDIDTLEDWEYAERMFKLIIKY